MKARILRRTWTASQPETDLPGVWTLFTGVVSTYRASKRASAGRMAARNVAPIGEAPVSIDDLARSAISLGWQRPPRG